MILAAAVSMSAGVRAWELTFVNGDREFAAPETIEREHSFPVKELFHHPPGFFALTLVRNEAFAVPAVLVLRVTAGG
jgi:hypothetical protein